MTLCAQYTDNMKKRILAQNGTKPNIRYAVTNFAKASLAAIKAIKEANKVLILFREKDYSGMLRYMKSRKPRSRKQGRMIRKAELLMKYPTIIGYGK